MNYTAINFRQKLSLFHAVLDSAAAYRLGVRDTINGTGESVRIEER